MSRDMEKDKEGNRHTDENDEALHLKQQWAEAGVDFYLESDKPFTLKNLAEYLESNSNTGAEDDSNSDMEMDTELQKMYLYFSDSDDLLEFYYELQVLKYNMMIRDIDGFEQLSLSEKFSNTVYTLFDLFSERREFIAETYKGLIMDSHHETGFEHEIKALFKQFIENDPRVSISSQFVMWPLFYTFITNEYLHLVHFWVDDTTENYERSMAFTDKVTSFLEELMYSKILDKGFDLGRFLTSNNVISHRYPLLSYLIPTWLFESESEPETTEESKSETESN